MVSEGQANHLWATKAKFCQLQAQLRDRWQTIEQFDLSDYDILVVPSLSLDQSELLKVAGSHHYEERLLFSLIRLRNPRTRLVYVTSQPLAPIIIDYYLQLLPGIPFSHARERLVLLSTYDASHVPLTQKILERPRLIDRIRKALRTRKAYMICFNSTPLERELSVELGIPLWALNPDLLHLGTKSGSRSIFAETHVPHPDGSPLVHSPHDLAKEAAALWDRQPQLRRMVVKLNEGFSGEGNAILELAPIRTVEMPQRAAAIADSFPHLRFQSLSETWTNFAKRLPDLGAIVEAFIEGEEKRSPSVQGRIAPTGEVEILSTHDQILGGPDAQVYLGCSFPADASYRLQLQEFGMRIGKTLAAKGVLERFGVDFVAVRQQDDSWDLQAIEINLRKGGTTHPLMTLRFLTNGQFNLGDGLFYSQHGREKYYIATDTLQKGQYNGLLPHDLMDIIAHHRLHFDSSTETGTVFHLISCLSEFGKLGLTSIGNSPQEAQDIYDRVVEVLDRETLAAIKSDASCSGLED
ncbi:peptide ligase PGM1-related protein [Tumidithrix elongata RA019]|uniref:Peptide ligase PGM1-related protein n=1 Tax=Tumidithrix elongata BACA0141 TaxID=2716417 RepID=A0AAW9Q5L6_9CYAN|nr:peptide ligase PGM1-related protein [Tumidithrix elongata RA019]